jgi:hypothetical protein
MKGKASYTHGTTHDSRCGGVHVGQSSLKQLVSFLADFFESSGFDLIDNADPVTL